MSYVDSIKGLFAQNIAEAIDKSVDGRKMTERIEELLEKHLGKVAAEKIQRGTVVNLLLEMVEGLFDGDTAALKARVEVWTKNLKEAATPASNPESLT